MGDGSFTTDTTSTANALLNNFYPDDTTDTTDRQRYLRSLLHKPIGTQDEPPFTRVEVIQCLKAMNHKKAPGPDHLTSDICLQFAEAFPGIITDIMNRCLELGYFPEQWKIAYAKIIPKPARTDHTDTSSFRPIGLINVFGKLLERLITDRLSFFTNRTSSLREEQYGFKQQCSTVNAISNALNIINSAKHNGEQVIAVSLDIKAAFDHAWWPAIFFKLRNIDCPRNIYNILRSYVTNRKVVMKFADCQVDKGMTRGCVQGSVCGPILWNVILDELLSIDLPDGCHLQAYADDVLLIVHDKNIADLETKTSSVLSQAVAWGDTVKLKFSPDKTHAIGFTKKSSKCNIYFDSQRIAFVTSFKLLGVVVDHKLTFVKHCDYIVQKARKLFNKLVTFVRPTWGAHPENIRIIYESVIQPIVCYAASVWEGALRYSCVGRKLLSLQRLFAIKIIQGFRTVSTATSISLAQLSPLPAKIAEIADVEHTKIRGYSKYLPTDVPIELTAKPSALLHPSLRTGVQLAEVSDASELDSILDAESTKIYTDGSKHDDKVGAAYVIYSPGGGVVAKKLKLHDCCSVFQAELLALDSACAWIISKRVDKTIIMSDSQSGLAEIGNPNSRNHFAVNIHRSVHSAKLLGLDVKFVWIRAHTGIPGNEHADAVAKAAALLHKQPDYCHVPISFIKYHNRLDTLQASKDLFNNCTHLRTILPDFDDLVLYLKANSTPKFAMTQYFTNHGYHKSYLNRFKIVDDDLCPCDDQSRQTLDHLIKDCPRFGETRMDYLVVAEDEEPYNVRSMLKRRAVMEAFHRYIQFIVAQLKGFNGRDTVACPGSGAAAAGASL